MVGCYPTFFLKNEHVALLGQLDLLEMNNGKWEVMIPVLQALGRNCETHFRHEDVLLEELSATLESGGRHLRSLVSEHESLEQEVEGLLALLMNADPQDSMKINQQVSARIRDFAKHFYANIQHEERVVFLLAETRLTPVQLGLISQKILAL